MKKLVSAATALFPLWAILVSVWAYLRPDSWKGFSGLIVPLLGLVMFGMGSTLSGADFRRVFRRPGVIGLGLVSQFGVMPLLALGLSRLFGLSPQLTAGMVLVGSVSGGTASNVITYLARGDTALSISLTFSSTVLAVAVTPALTWLYLHRTVPVRPGEMLLGILQIVLLPLLAGMAVNRLWNRSLDRLRPAFPLISVAAIVLIIGIVIGLNREKIAQTTLVVVVAVILHNLGGMVLGYSIGRALKNPPAVCRTLAIEVGMQNSGLAVALGLKYFSAAAALPGALFSIWHNLAGAAAAAWWNRISSPAGNTGD